MTTDTKVASPSTISERVADYVVGLRYDDIPSSVVDRAKELLVFHLGLGLRGRAMERGQRGVRLAYELSSAGGDCSIVGESRRFELLDAVFANATLMSSVGFIDLLFPSGVVPGMTVHPAAWAVGEKTEASGQELLSAVVVGYDVMAKLHSGVLPYESAVPRPTKAAVEPFGVAVAAARLLGLSHEQTVDAMSHAGQAIMSIYEGTKGLAMMHPLAARNGAMAAMQASVGMPGVATIVEGPHGIYRTFFLSDVPEVVHANLATLGRDFEVAKVGRTHYPFSRGNTLPVDLTRQLVTEHGLTADRVAAVDLVLPRSREAREAIYGTYPKGPTSVVAIALTDGRVDPERFEEPFGPEVLAARDKVRLRFEDDHGFFYARVEVTTTDGQRFAAEDDDPGEPPPIDWAEWLADSGRAILPEGQLAELADQIRQLEDVPNVADVMACVTPRV
jgi:2-methylcitrate dehydratase PrpD